MKAECVKGYMRAQMQY